MRTDDFRPSSNVEDDREASASRGMPGGGGGLGIGAVIIVGLVSWYFGVDPSIILNLLGGVGSPSEQSSPAPSVAPGTPDDPTGKFVALVLGDTEDRWTEMFAAGGKTYHPPKLRLFAGSEPTPCAFARSAMGPFYCPRDQRIYLDTSFFQDMQRKFGACSDASACRFSQAYVIAHEVGHHVQDELGILPRVMQAQQAASSQEQANALQVRVELQADCLAGVWASRSAAEEQVSRSRRSGPGVADRVCNWRRSAAETNAGLCRAELVYPRQFRTAQAVVPQRLQFGAGLELQYAFG